MYRLYSVLYQKDVNCVDCKKKITGQRYLTYKLGEFRCEKCNSVIEDKCSMCKSSFETEECFKGKLETLVHTKKYQRLIEMFFYKMTMAKNYVKFVSRSTKMKRRRTKLRNRKKQLQRQPQVNLRYQQRLYHLLRLLK